MERNPIPHLNSNPTQCREAEQEAAKIFTNSSELTAVGDENLHIECSMDANDIIIGYGHDGLLRHSDGKTPRRVAVAQVQFPHCRIGGVIHDNCNIGCCSADADESAFQHPLRPSL